MLENILERWKTALDYERYVLERKRALLSSVSGLGSMDCEKEQDKYRNEISACMDKISTLVHVVSDLEFLVSCGVKDNG